MVPEDHESVVNQAVPKADVAPQRRALIKGLRNLDGVDLTRYKKSAKFWAVRRRGPEGSGPEGLGPSRVGAFKGLGPSRVCSFKGLGIQGSGPSRVWAFKGRGLQGSGPSIFGAFKGGAFKGGVFKGVKKTKKGKKKKTG